MPSIKPFKAVIYNKKKIVNLAKVIAPPYDIIPPRMQDALYRAHPHNVVRLILGKIRKTDTSSDNRYTRAQKCFRAWQKSGIMIQDKAPAFYVYSQIYKYGKRSIERIGFVGLMRLDLGRQKKVLAHENTLRAPKVDRLQLIRKVKSNLSPIFVMYDDNSHAVTKILKMAIVSARPFVDIRSEGVINRVWRLDDKNAIKSIEKAIGPKNTFIADGHHRYEVARTYASEVLADRNASSALKTNAKFLMAYFVELDERMLTILPTHRLIKDIGTLTADEIVAKAGELFAVERAHSFKELMDDLGRMAKTCAFGLYLGKGRFYSLKIKDPDIVERLITVNSKDWRRLDVTILHLLVMQKLLGIRDEDDNVEFEKDPRKAVSFVDKGQYPVAFLLNPTKATQVKRVAQRGERMPRKATYFYPKPLSGLVINKLDR